MSDIDSILWEQATFIVQICIMVAEILSSGLQSWAFWTFPGGTGESFFEMEGDKLKVVLYLSI